MPEKIKVIAVVGPTASGKTDLGVKIAQYVGGEVVSADSMQIYDSMPVASAAPTEEEMCGVTHHLIGFKKPQQKFSVAEYIKLAERTIQDIVARGKVPVIVGGTGLYIDSLLSGVSFSDEDNTEVRAKLESEADEKGIEALFERLRKIDPEHSAKLHVNDRKRIIRALEVYEIHGKSITEINEASKINGSNYDVLWIGLTFNDREKLYSRINLRVDKMLENGLLQEAKAAFDSNVGKTAVQAIGHKEFFPYFNGEISLQQAVENLKTETRRYAKRQLTWFRRNKDINYIYVDDSNVFENAKRLIDNL